jgi:hypothetical protein
VKEGEGAKEGEGGRRVKERRRAKKESKEGEALLCFLPQTRTHSGPTEFSEW